MKENILNFLVALGLIFLGWLLCSMISSNYFTQLVKGVAKFYKYNENYTCYDFSKDLARILNENGYYSRVKCGYKNESDPSDRGHSWVEVKLYIDAQTGLFVPNKYFDSKYPDQFYCG